MHHPLCPGSTNPTPIQSHTPHPHPLSLHPGDNNKHTRIADPASTAAILNVFLVSHPPQPRRNTIINHKTQRIPAQDDSIDEPTTHLALGRGTVLDTRAHSEGRRDGWQALREHHPKPMDMARCSQSPRQQRGGHAHKTGQEQPKDLFRLRYASIPSREADHQFRACERNPAAPQYHSHHGPEIGKSHGVG